MSESQSHKLLVTFAILGSMFRDIPGCHIPTVKELEAGEKKRREEIDRDAKRNFKKTMAKLRSGK